MIEHDYLMRIIHDMIKTIIKLLFNINEDNIENMQVDDVISAEKYKKLIELAKNGNINEAENQLYKYIDISNKNELKIALMFYSYLNNLDNKTLEKANYTYEEIGDGVKYVMNLFGYDGIADMLM